MAMRGSPARRVVGNPLAGVLSHLDQRSRIAGRRVTSSAPVEGLRQAAAEAGGCVGAVLVTGEDGRACWTFPAVYECPPVVSAAAVDPVPGDDERTVWAVVEEVTSWSVTVRVWRSRPRRGTGVAEPAGAGLSVHVTVVPVAAG